MIEDASATGDAADSEEPDSAELCKALAGDCALRIGSGTLVFFGEGCLSRNPAVEIRMTWRSAPPRNRTLGFSTPRIAAMPLATAAKTMRPLNAAGGGAGYPKSQISADAHPQLSVK